MVIKSKVSDLLLILTMFCTLNVGASTIRATQYSICKYQLKNNIYPSSCFYLIKGESNSNLVNFLQDRCENIFSSMTVDDLGKIKTISKIKGPCQQLAKTRLKTLLYEAEEQDPWAFFRFNLNQ